MNNISGDLNKAATVTEMDIERERAEEGRERKVSMLNERKGEEIEKKSLYLMCRK